MNRIAPVVVALALLAGPASAQSNPSKPPTSKPPSSSVRTWSFSFGTSQGRLGTQVMTMTEELRAYFGAPRTAGVLVSKVEPGSDGARAGVRVGDVITRVDDGQFKWKSLNRTAGGELLPNIDEVVVVRSPSAQ